MARDKAQMLEMGERIRTLREASGLSQKTVAAHCNVEVRTYQFWQQGKHPPSPDALPKLAELFGVTPQYILRGETPEPLQSPSVEERLKRIERHQKEILARLDDLAAVVEKLSPRPSDETHPPPLGELGHELSGDPPTTEDQGRTENPEEGETGRGAGG